MIKSYQKKSIKLLDTAWKKLVQEAFERDGYMCQLNTEYCTQGKEYLVPHHIIPKGRLRLDILDNILTLCTCHIPLHDNLLHVSVNDLIDKYNMRKYMLL